MHCIGFIGAGQMARALANGLLEAGLFEPAQIWASDSVEQARSALELVVPGAQTTPDNVQLASKVDVMVLAIKPQQMDAVLAEIAPHSESKLIISIAAGIRLERLSSAFGDNARLVRAMPNTPCLVGQSATAYSLGGSASEGDAKLADQIFSAVGKAVRVEEELLDAVTGLSGSGPAYICVIIESLSDGGVRMGLPRDVANSLAIQTVRGTAELLAATGEHPAIVKDRVASPGGTTIAGLEALESHGLRASLIAAVEAATERSIELGRQ